ncbi:ROK family protein [Mesobacillus campisalis]|uniref:ROK family protein n=1 Tax=Mesobacillus campisalis TaxID=1408103 RepID=A0A0M2SU60_9BACI|nr:ROK family transcriptional regulator [Mesobacillus campisalis]KKK36150.1 ROK family protein [Mesobacillus campisalis]
MATGDAAFIKKINRSIIIKQIIEQGMISRADLSKITNLTRATISAQVADLIEDGLLLETDQEHLSVGRKPIMLSLNSEAGYALGIDLDYGEINFTLSDLLGIKEHSETIKIDTIDYNEVLNILISQINKYIDACQDRRYGIVGIVIAIHGLVSKDEIIKFVPRFKWHDIRLKEDLQRAINIDIYVENNANLSSFAERVFIYHQADNLVSTSFLSGIGLGVMVNNEFFRGNEGFAGEIGHMIVMPGGKPCNCGNFGCWEQYASETSFFKELSKKKGMESITYTQVLNWLKEGDETVHQQMEQFIYFLTIGLNNMINIYNPDVIVLDSELLRQNPAYIDEIKKNLVSSISHYRELSVSRIGKRSSIMGACALAIKHFLEVPMLDLSFEEHKRKEKMKI